MAENLDSAGKKVDELTQKLLTAQETAAKLGQSLLDAAGGIEALKAYNSELANVVQNSILMNKSGQGSISLTEKKIALMEKEISQYAKLN